MAVRRGTAAEKAQFSSPNVNEVMRGSGRNTDTVSRCKGKFFTPHGHPGLAGNNMVNLFRVFMSVKQG